VLGVLKDVKVQLWPGFSVSSQDRKASILSPIAFFRPAAMRCDDPNHRADAFELIY
jgi:hypothetical protein